MSDTPLLPTAEEATRQPSSDGGLLREIAARSDISLLPRRVRAAIEAHDKRSEVLVRLLQLAVVAVFGVLYAFSPKTDAGTAFSPVPYVLAAYGIFTIAGLAWTMRGNVPNLGVYAMTFVDMLENNLAARPDLIAWVPNFICQGLGVWAILRADRH